MINVVPKTIANEGSQFSSKTKKCKTFDLFTKPEIIKPKANNKATTKVIKY